MRRITRVAGAVTLFAGFACASPEAPDVAAPSVEAEAGLCVEHGVMEAVCTKCNPSLIPVFQAKGDFCPEHGFPMSFCPVHHPEMGGRPATELSKDDGAPAHGTKIRFKTRDTAEAAGLKFAPAALAVDDGGIEAVAKLTWDAKKQAIVGARAAGHIQTLHVEVGTLVRPGDSLATVHSAEIAGDRSALEAARTRKGVAERSLERKRSIAHVIAKAEIDAAEQEAALASAEVSALESELQAVGGGTAKGYTVTAPIAGILVERQVSVGSSVEAGTPLFEIADPSTLRAEIDVPEAEIGQVAVGQSIRFTFDGSAQSYAGTLEYLAPVIDPETRTARATATLANPNGELRANAYGTARIAVGGEREVVIVPQQALQSAKGVDLVFVQLAVDEFETRRVQVIRRQGAQVYLSKGVESGEIVVTEGSFLLKTETLTDSIGAGCCDVE